MVSAHQENSLCWELVIIPPAKSNGRWDGICFTIQNSRKKNHLDEYDKEDDIIGAALLINEDKGIKPIV